MKKRFFTHEEVVFNLDHIVRIYTEYDIHAQKTRYKVMVTGLLVYDISENAYIRLIQFIKGEESK